MSQIEFDYNERNLALVQELMGIVGVADCEELPNKVRGLLRDAELHVHPTEAGGAWTCPRCNLSNKQSAYACTNCDFDRPRLGG